MKSRENTPQKGDIILLKDFKKNLIHTALVLNKKFHFSTNYSSTYIGEDHQFLPSLSVKQALIFETPCTQFQTTEQYINLLPTEFEKSVVEKALSFINNLDKPATELNYFEKHYFFLATLFTQKSTLILVDHIDFKNNIELEQLYIRSLLSFKGHRTIVIKQQDNALDLLSSYIIHESEGKFITEPTTNNITQIEHFRTQKQNNQHAHQAEDDSKKVA